MVGCPILNFGQQFYVDFGTGTSIDDVYHVNGISHSFTAGTFTTEVELTPLNKQGQYDGLVGNLNKALQTSGDIKDKLTGYKSENVFIPGIGS